MAYRVVFQRSASIELAKVIQYLKSFGAQPVQSFQKEWNDLLGSLRSGMVEYRLSRFDSLAELGYRTAFVKNYVVLFYYEDELVAIAHIFHQAQDYAAFIMNE